MVHLLSTLSASQVRYIAFNFCHAPREAVRRMLAVLKSVEIYLSLVIVRNRFNVMIEKKLATEEVKHAAIRVLGRNKRGIQSEEKRIMKKRRDYIQKEINRAKYEWMDKCKELEVDLIDKRAKDMFRRIEHEYRQYVWKMKLNISKKKVQFAMEKDMKRKNYKKQTDVEDRFYLITDTELESDGMIPRKKNFEVYGDVNISKQEEKCLSLGPKYMITPKLDRDLFEVEIEVESVKTRYEIVERMQVMEEDGEVKKEDLQGLRERNKEDKSIVTKDGYLRMSHLRATDAKYNVRSAIPKSVNNEDEALLQVRRKAVMDDFDEYVKKNCGRNGVQNNMNMTEEQKKGMSSLQKRVKEGEIVITTTDKSGKFAVVDKELYVEAANVHLKDEEITVDQVREIEILINRHSMQVVKALEMGTIHGKNGQVSRIKKAFRSNGGRPGPVQFLVKDHKKVKEGSKIPPTRQVCSAKSGPSSRLSNLISIILNRIADAIDGKAECTSTEELMRKIFDTNKNIKERCDTDPDFKRRVQKAELISIDVKALYPSLRIKEAGKIIMEMITRVQDNEVLNFEDVDFFEIGKYLAITCTTEELRSHGLEETIPKRTAQNRGPKPTPAYWESDMRDIKVGGETIQVEKWTNARVPKREEGHKMIGLMIVKAMATVMSNHTYRFGGKMYKQTDGGPIGDEMAQAVARVVMLWFDEKFEEDCKKDGTELLFYMRYVDDGNMLALTPEDQEEIENGEENDVDKRDCQYNCRACGALTVENSDWSDEEIREELAKIGYQDVALNALTAFKKDLSLLFCRVYCGSGVVESRSEEVGKRCRNIANKVTEILEFEEDTCDNHANKQLPILDLNTWLEKEGVVQIKHVFYKKPMTTKYTLLNGTAYPNGRLRAVLIEEVLRRLRNCSPDMDWKEKGKFVTEYAKEMKNSGHSEKFRKEIIERAIEKYKTILHRHNNGEKIMYRTRQERKVEIAERGGKAEKDTWFRGTKNGGKEETTSILRVPYTRGVMKSLVNRTLKTNKKPEGTLAMAQEDSGDRLLHQLVKPDPFPSLSCGRPTCKTITNRNLDGACNNTCWQNHVNYTVICKECEQNRRKEDKKFVYIGESSRGCHTRYLQEREEYNQEKKGFMYKHAEECHGGDQSIEFVMRRECVNKDPVRRVVMEALRIERAVGDPSIVIMNSREEHYGPQMVRSKFGTEWLMKDLDM